MKSIKFLTVLMLLCFVTPTEAQFLKKLKKKAGEAVEQTVLNRTEKEVSEATDDAIDSMIESQGDENQADQNSKNMQQSIQSLFGGGNIDNIPDQYSFSYKAVMEITSKNDKNQLEYWLEPDVRYFGTKITQTGEDNLTVLDLDNQSMTMFMHTDDQRLIMPMRTDNQLFKKILENAEEESKPEHIDFVEIESKTILGYHCKGYEFTTQDGVSKIWVTDQTPVGFNSGLFNTDNSLPNTFIPMDGKSMMMEMEFIPSKKNADTYSMKCIEFSKENMSVSKADYKSMLEY